MIRAFLSARTLTFVVIIISITTATASFGLMRNSLKDIRDHWQKNLLWSSSQLEIEYLRFREALARFSHGEEGVDSADVNRRFDILWSRVELFQQGAIADRMAEFPIALENLSALQAALEEQEAAVTSLKDSETEKAMQILAVFAQQDGRLRQFNRNIMKGEVALGASLRDNLSRNHQTLTWMGIGAIFVSMALFVFFAAESRRHRKIALENLGLLEKARLANRAKSAFLSMMSHDLRTPMNGILGSIALAKRQGVSPGQEHLLDQATQSSQQMNDLLTDILDFAALENTSAPKIEKPFEIYALKQSLTALMKTKLQDENATIAVRIAPDCPLYLLGDMRNLRRIVAHLGSYILRNAQTDSLNIVLAYQDGALQVKMSFLAGADAADWHPERVLRPIPESEDGFSTDALGPAMARGFVENLGGELRLDLPMTASDEGCITLIAPMQIHTENTVAIWAAFQSDALAAICKTALALPHVVFIEKDDATAVNVVVIEAGSDFERDSLAALHSRFPKASFVAFGKPRNPGLFDYEITLPLDVGILRAAPFVFSNKHALK